MYFKPRIINSDKLFLAKVFICFADQIEFGAGADLGRVSFVVFVFVFVVFVFNFYFEEGKSLLGTRF